MKKLFWIATTVVILLSMTGCRLDTFVIEDDNFQATDVCDGTGTLEIFMKNGAVQAKGQGDTQITMLKDGMPSVWCHGLTHRFTGTVTVSGYTFESDVSDPLEFTVDRDKGLYYTSCKGIVTDPDGKVTTLP